MIIEAAGALADREKCIRQPVLIVAKNVKFPLNQMDPNRCIVGTAIRSIGQRDFSDLFFLFFFFLLDFIARHRTNFFRKSIPNLS